MKQTYLAKMPKLTLSIKDWLFADLKQGIALADQHDLLGDLDISNLKITKPSSKEIYFRCFTTLKKLCFLPLATLIIEMLIEILWFRLMKHRINDYHSMVCGLIPFAGIGYGLLICLISFRLIWKYNLIILAICSNLKYGTQITFIMRSYVKFGIKLFFMIMCLLSSISIFFYYTPIALFSFFPTMLIAYIITSYIFKMEVERAGIQAIFNNVSSILSKTSNVN